ncbi:hypothetical protein FOA52_002066 [Chlamydomonas sp. UWO 241]|nr:hypothetical protein FOA52_002066 [Chlamydomonas sp. UWO 241]
MCVRLMLSQHTHTHTHTLHAANAMSCARRCASTSTLARTHTHTHHAANGTCLRSALCQHCANDVLQLNRAPAERFAGEGEGGRARCLICRETSVRAAKLTPLRAYYVNHPLMDAMDKLALGAYCQKCDSEFPGQAALQAHYLKECPHAVVQCRFTGCPLFGVRASLTAHEYTCGMGRVVCAQCEEHVDRDELVDHMVATCRLRSVVCSLCNKRMRLPDMLQHLREHQAQLQMQVFVKKQRHSLSGSTASAGVSASGSSGPHRTSASANASGLSGLSGAGGPSRAGAGSGSSSSSGPSRAGASANASGLGGLTGPSGAGTSGGLSEAQQAQQQQQQQQQQAQQPQQQPQQQQLRAPAPVSASLAAHGASLLGGAAPLGASERHAPMSTSPPQAPHAARPQHHHAEPPRRLSERVQAQVMSALSTPADVLCALGAPTFRRRRSGSGAATANAAQRQGQQGQQQQPGQQQQQGQRSGGAHGAAPSHLSAVAASLNSGGPALGAAAAAPIAWRGASPGTSASGTPSTSPTVACAVAAASALVWHAPPAPQWQQQQGQGQGQPAAPAGAGVQSSSSSSTLAAVEQQQQQQQAPASEQQRTASQSSLRSAPNSAPHSGPLQASTASGPAAAAAAPAAAAAAAPAAAPATAAAATAAAAAAAGDDATYPALSPSGLPPNEYRLLLEMLQSLTSRRDAAQQLLLQQEQQQQEQQQQGQQHGQQRGRSDGAATGIREGGPGGGAHDDAPALAPDAPASEQQHVLPLGAIGAGAGGSGEPEAVRSAFDATARGRDAGGSGGAGDSVSARSCSTSSSARSSGSGASDAGGAPRPQPSLPSTRLRAYPLPTRLPDRLGAHAFAAAPGSPIGSGSNATLFTIWRPRARSSSGHDAGGDAAAAGLEPGSTRASHEGEHGRSTLCAAAGGAGGVGRGTGSQGALMDQVDEAITMLAEHQADGHTARWGSGSLERSASDGEALRRYTAELCAARDAVSAMLLPAS